MRANAHLLVSNNTPVKHMFVRLLSLQAVEVTNERRSKRLPVSFDTPFHSGVSSFPLLQILGVEL